MKLSVVTCTWNSAATLGDTIDSVQSQRHAEIEHIFVDGGSTDGTLEMIARRCPAARVLRGVSSGISRAMNEGAAVATGEVLAHLHSDDYYAADDVAAGVLARFSAQPQLKWLFGRIAVLRDGELQMPKGAARPFSREAYLRGAASVPHPAVFIRTHAFRALGGFDTELRYAMDIDLWLRLSRVAVPMQIEQVLAVFREHAGSVSTANVLAARAEEWLVRRGHFRSAPVDTAIYALRYLRRTARLRRALAAPGG